MDKTYIVIKNAVSQELCALITDYVHCKANLRPNIKKSKFLKNVHREYADPLMETLLAKLTPKIEEATNLALWPTLSFCYRYTHGNQLAPHKDRSSCQVVAGLCIGADEKFSNSQGSWPLILENNGIPTPITLNFGDIVVFKGYETKHWREPFPGDWFISAIFAYVEKTGPYAFQKYDQRTSLGKPHVGMFHWLYGCIKNKLQPSPKNSVW